RVPARGERAPAARHARRGWRRRLAHPRLLPRGSRERRRPDQPARGRARLGLLRRRRPQEAARGLGAAMRFRLAWLLLAALCSATAQAQMAGRKAGSENDFTFFGGFRTGGDLMEATTEQDLHADTTPSFALAIDIAYEPRKQLQLFYSHQKTQLTPATVPAPVVTDRTPLRIDYLHIGGTAFFEDTGEGGYATAGVGATRITPASRGLPPDTTPSLSIAFGYMVPPVPALAPPPERRGSPPGADSRGGLFCKPGPPCPASIKGDGFYQGEGLIGLTARF